MHGKLQAREKQIVEKERMAAIGQLAAGIAHEINNPIQIIRGYLKTMATDGCPEEFVDELRIIDEEAAVCQRIADDLVAYARTAVGCLRPSKAAPSHTSGRGGSTVAQLRARREHAEQPPDSPPALAVAH